MKEKERKLFLKKGSLFILGIFFLFFFLGLVMFVKDPSMTEPSPLLTPEAYEGEYKPRPPVVLITYAHGHPVFFKNENMLMSSIADKGVDFVFKYTQGHIDPDFYKRHQALLSQKRGAGYWLWKPYFIVKTLESLPEEAILLYADSGTVFTKPLDRIYRLFQDSSLILVSHGKLTPLKTHLKKEAYGAFGAPLTEELLESQNVWAFFMGLRNNKKNRDLMKKWLEVCEKEEILGDYPQERTHQDPLFSYHQHDQSLLSVLVALEQRDDMKIIPRNILRKQYGIHNFHRHPEAEFSSPLLIMGGAPRWFSAVFWNNPLLVYGRKLLKKACF